MYESSEQSALCARLVFGGELSVGREGEICVYQAVDTAYKSTEMHFGPLNSCLPQLIFKDNYQG